MLNRSDNSFLLPSLISITSFFLFHVFTFSSLSWPPTSFCPIVSLYPFLCLFDKSRLFKDPCVTLLASKLLHLRKTVKLWEKEKERDKKVRVGWEKKEQIRMRLCPPPPSSHILCWLHLFRGALLHCHVCLRSSFFLCSTWLLKQRLIDPRTRPQPCSLNARSDPL